MAHRSRLTSDSFSALCRLKGFISPGDLLLSKHLIIPLHQGDLIWSLHPAESAEHTEFDRHTKKTADALAEPNRETFFLMQIGGSQD